MADGFDGAIMTASIFDLNKTLLGTVSITFDPAELLNNVIASLLKDTSYAVTVSQLDSKIVYDTDPSQQGKVLFDPFYAEYTDLLALWRHVSEESSGYGTYSFSTDEASQIAKKECFWASINACSQEWRIALIQTLPA